MNEKKRTITLSGRAPVRIVEAEWPVIAVAMGDSFAGSDYCRREQALSRGECDRYSIRVRQHGDGRAIVYAVFDGATPWTGSEDRSGGELLDAAADIPAAIRRVGEDVGIPDRVIRECVADLPAKEV